MSWCAKWAQSSLTLSSTSTLSRARKGAKCMNCTRMTLSFNICGHARKTWICVYPFSTKSLAKHSLYIATHFLKVIAKHFSQLVDSSTEKSTRFYLTIVAWQMKSSKASCKALHFWTDSSRLSISRISLTSYQWMHFAQSFRRKNQMNLLSSELLTVRYLSGYRKT